MYGGMCVRIPKPHMHLTKLTLILREMATPAVPINSCRMTIDRD